jgi:hypothetical protein
VEDRKYEPRTSNYKQTSFKCKVVITQGFLSLNKIVYRYPFIMLCKSTYTKSFKLDGASYLGKRWKVQEKKFAKYLLTVQFFGALMFAVACASYLLGLPTDTVLHGELAFRIVIGILGSVFFVGSIVMLAVAFLKR